MMNLRLNKNGIENIGTKPLTEKEKQAILENSRNRVTPRFTVESAVKSVPLFQCHNCYRQVERGVLHCEVCSSEQVSKKTYQEVQTEPVTIWEIIGVIGAVLFGVLAFFAADYLMKAGIFG